MRPLLCLFLLFLLFPFWGCRLRVKDGPVIAAGSGDAYSWDFGQVKEGSVLEHGFVFKNEASRVLNIKEINTSCGCMAFGVEKKTLLPAESTVIKVRFNTKGYSGQNQQFVYVHTDSLDNPVFKITIKAEVEK